MELHVRQRSVENIHISNKIQVDGIEKKTTQEIKISSLSTTSAQKTYLQHHLLPV